MIIKLERKIGSSVEVFWKHTHYDKCDRHELLNLSRKLTGTTSGIGGVFSSNADFKKAGIKEERLPNGKVFIDFYPDNNNLIWKSVEIELIDYTHDSLEEIERKIKNNVTEVVNALNTPLPTPDILEFEL